MQNAHSDIIDSGGVVCDMISILHCWSFFMSCEIKFVIAGDTEPRYVSLPMSYEEYLDPDVVCARLFMRLMQCHYSPKELLSVKVIKVWYES